MARTDRRKLDELLAKLFEAERTVRRLHDEIAQADKAEVIDAIGGAVEVASKEPGDEASLRLSRLAALLGEFSGDHTVDLLIDILGSEHAEARFAAGQELNELAFDRFKEVALGVERALKRLPAGSPALSEIPYILVQIPEPGVAKLLKMFLSHNDPDAVAAALEAAVDLGDRSLANDIAKLKDDTREVELDDESGETDRVTLGMLATEAHELLSSEDDAE